MASERGVDRNQRFADRVAAGRELEALLAGYVGSDAIVLALPRGGVVVGYEIAQRLALDLDVYVARKLGAPGQPELGIGAVAPGVVFLDNETIRVLGVTPAEVERVVDVERLQLERNLTAFRGERPWPRIEGRSVILVDDGLATGVTASAAALALRRLDPVEIVLAVPVAASQGVEVLRSRVDAIVCPVVTTRLGAVGLWYADFEQVSDEKVVELLNDIWRESGRDNSA